MEPKDNAVKLGDKELFGHPKIVPYSQKFLIHMKKIGFWSREIVP